MREQSAHPASGVFSLVFFFFFSESLILHGKRYSVSLWVLKTKEPNNAWRVL